MRYITKIIAITLLLWAVSYAAVPHLINYQGRLTDSGGTPLNGSYSLTFRIYDAETAGNLLWEETHSGAVIQKGIFSLLLGSVTALNLPFDKQYFLEIKVGNEVMSPRQRITSSGYALRAEKAEQANNADTVNNINASTTPAPNKLLPLDANAKLPISALKVYDSGWFAATTNTLYTKTHNLGTTKVLVQIFFAANSDGTGLFGQPTSSYYYEPYQNEQVTYITGLTTTQIKVRAAPYGFGSFLDDDNNRIRSGTSGYLRIIMLALE